MLDVDGKDYGDRSDENQRSVHLSSPNVLLLRHFQDHFGGKLRPPKPGHVSHGLWFFKDHRRILLQKLEPYRFPNTDDALATWSDDEKIEWARGAVAIAMTHATIRAPSASQAALLREVLLANFPTARISVVEMRLKIKKERDAIRQWATTWIDAEDTLTAEGIRRWEEAGVVGVNALADRRSMPDVNAMRLQESQAARAPCHPYTPRLTPALRETLRAELHDTKITYKELADKYRLTTNQLKYFAKTEGLQRATIVPGRPLQEMRDFVKSLALVGTRAMDIHTRLCARFGLNACALSTTLRWRREALRQKHM